MSITDKSRNWCFTLNNYTDKEILAIKENCELNKYVFLCFGYELSETGTPHLQGYIELRNPRFGTGLKKDKGLERAHLEPRCNKSTKLKAVTYCAKELGKQKYMAKLFSEWEAKKEKNPNLPAPEYDQKLCLRWMRYNLEEWRPAIFQPYQKLYFESGNWKHGLHPGTRSDINVVKEMVIENKSMWNILEHANSYQSARMAQLMMTYKKPSRNFKSKVYWFYGPTNSGKTRMARELCSYPKDIWESTCGNMQWFDGYDYNKVAILDDFRRFYHGFAEFLKLLDRYPYKVPVKGGFVDWCPKEIFITSKCSPFECYQNEDEDLQQLIRRIDEIVNFRDIDEKING